MELMQKKKRVSLGFKTLQCRYDVIVIDLIATLRRCQDPLNNIYFKCLRLLLQTVYVDTYNVASETLQYGVRV